MNDDGDHATFNLVYSYYPYATTSFPFSPLPETEYRAFLGDEGMRLLRSSLLILLEQSNQEGEKAQ